MEEQEDSMIWSQTIQRKSNWTVFAFSQHLTIEECSLLSYMNHVSLWNIYIYVHTYIYVVCYDNIFICIQYTYIFKYIHILHIYLHIDHIVSYNCRGDMLYTKYMPCASGLYLDYARVYPYIPSSGWHVFWASQFEAKQGQHLKLPMLVFISADGKFDGLKRPSGLGLEPVYP